MNLWNMHEAFRHGAAHPVTKGCLPLCLSVCRRQAPFTYPFPCGGGAVTNRKRPLGHALYFKAPNERTNATSEKGTEGEGHWVWVYVTHAGGLNAT